MAKKPTSFRCTRYVWRKGEIVEWQHSHKITEVISNNPTDLLPEVADFYSLNGGFGNDAKIECNGYDENGNLVATQWTLTIA